MPQRALSASYSPCTKTASGRTIGRHCSVHYGSTRARAGRSAFSGPADRPAFYRHGHLIPPPHFGQEAPHTPRHPLLFPDGSPVRLLPPADANWSTTRALTVGLHMRISNGGAGHLQVPAAVKRRREGTGLDRYKIPPSGARTATPTFCISMADPTRFDDTLPSEWYEVSVSTIYLSYSCSQNLVSLHVA